MSQLKRHVFYAFCKDGWIHEFVFAKCTAPK